MKKGVKTGKVKTTYCTECKCIDPANQGEDEPATCAKPQYKGDGNCDDKNNNEACEYDGGDCCAKSVTNNKGVATGVVITKYCNDCECLDPDNQGEGEAAPTCGKPQFKGDGNCDDDNNNAACEYDGGDCCAKTVKNKRGISTGTVIQKFCSECTCLDPNGAR